MLKLYCILGSKLPHNFLT